MAEARFDEIWIPRIGEDAAQALHKNLMCTLILGPISIGLAVGGGFGLGSGKPLGVVLGILAPALIISFIAYWTRTRRSLAKAMSLGLGETITPREIPRMTAEEFDAWRERRNRRATHA